MKNLYPVLFLFVLSTSSFAQVTFLKNYEGINKGFVVGTRDGGYAIACSTPTTGDVSLTRTDANGNIIWSKAYGGNNLEYPNDLRLTSDQGFIITGTTNSFGAGDYDLYVIRTDSSGDTLWTRAFGSTGGEVGWSGQQTSDGGFIFSSDYGGGSVCYLVRTDKNGDTLWTKIYNCGRPWDIIQNPDKGFTATGAFYTFAPGHQGDDVFIFRMDSLGNTRWFRNYGSTNVDYGYKIINSNDGGYIVSGFSSGFGKGDEDIYILKTDTAGKLLWSKTYGAASSTEEGISIISTGNGYAILSRTTTNSTNFDGVLIRIDNNGNMIWSKRYTSFGETGSVVYNSDKGFTITGYADNLLGSSNNLLNVLRTDSFGNIPCNDSAFTIDTTQPVSHTDTFIPANSYGTTVTHPHTAMSNGSTSVTVVCENNSTEKITANGNSFFVFPNPCKECFLQGNMRAQDLSITNLMGQNIAPLLILNSSGLTINLNEVPPGMYFVRDVKTGQVAKIIHQ